MDINKLSEPLDVSYLEFRVQSVNKGGYATLLVYKDARVDMQRLDLAVGPLNWKREHVGDNRNCIVSIWCEDKKQWVSKEDTGNESNSDAAKGLASDSFKRACFNWGIGRELYEYPVISVKLLDSEINAQTKKPSWGFKLKEWSWSVEFKSGAVSFLQGKDQSGAVRYSFGRSSKPSDVDLLWIQAIKDGKETLDTLEKQSDVNYRNHIQSLL